MVYLSVAVGAAMALAAAAAADAFLSTASALTTNVAVVLKHVPPPDIGSGMTLMHVCFVPSDLIRGHQIALLGLLVGGVPGGLLAAGLHAGVRRPWPGAFAAPFFAGFVFQVNSLALTTLLFLLVVPHAPFDPHAAAVPAGGFLLAITCNIWGLRSWRALQLAARETPPRVTPV